MSASNLRRVTKKRGAGGEGAKGRPPGSYVYIGGPTYVRKPVESIGRSPRERTAASRPLTEPQAQVLALLTREPTPVSHLSLRLDRPYHGVNSTLYALQDRGLVERVPRVGWRLTEESA